MQVPFAHTASQAPLFPSQVTWQGGAVQTKLQASPAGQVQVPPWHPPVGPQAASASASTRANPANSEPLIGMSAGHSNLSAAA